VTNKLRDEAQKVASEFMPRIHQAIAVIDNDAEWERLYGKEKFWNVFEEILIAALLAFKGEDESAPLDLLEPFKKEIADLTAQLEEAKKQLDAVATEEWDKLKDQNALLKEQLKNRLPMCPICGKEVALICPDDLKKLQDEGLRLEMLEGKLADGWCLVSAEDFERLQEAKRVGD